MNKRHRHAIAAMLVLLSCSRTFAQDSFVSSVPPWAKVIVRFNAREDSESIKTLTKYSTARPEQTEAFEQLLLGIAQAGLMQIGRDLDIQRDVLSWIGRQGGIAFAPGEAGQPETIMLMMEIRSRDSAAAFLQRALPAIASSAGGSIQTANVGGGMTWTLSLGGGHVSIGLGTSAIGISNKTDSVSAWLAGTDGSNAMSQRVNDALAKVPNGLISIYMDQSLVESKEMLGGNPAQEMLKLGSIVGSFTYQEDGAHYEIAALVGNGSIVQKAAASIPPGPSRGFMALPPETLFAIALTSPGALASAAPLPVDPASMITLMAGPLLGDVPASAINALLGSEIALALIRLDEAPSMALALAGTDATGMEQAFRALRGLAEKTGVVKISEADAGGVAAVKITGLLPPNVLADPEMPPAARQTLTSLFSEIHVGESGGRIVFASNMDTLMRSLSQKGGDAATLAGHSTFQRARSHMPEKSLLMVYADPSALLQQSATLAANMGNIRNKYLDRAFQLMGKGFPFVAFGLGVDNDALRIAAHIGLDYAELQKSSGAATAISAVAIGSAVMMPVFAQAREKARTVSCESNLKQLALAAMMYSQDYDDHFPKVATWQKDLKPYLGQRSEIFQCPSHPSIRYAMNPALSGISVAQIKHPETTILFYEVANSKPIFPHAGMQSLAFSDGHVDVMRPDAITADMWKPSSVASGQPKRPATKNPASSRKTKASSKGKKQAKKKK